MPKLTKTLATTTKQTVWDDMLPGFGVRVTRSGRRTYVMRYRTASRTERMMTLGRVEDMHPDDARELARENFKDVRHGKDPKADRDKLRKAPTVADLAKRFMEEHAEKKRPGTARNYEILWRRHILPRMGNLKVADVDHDDASALHLAMKATPVNANRALEVLTKAFTLAEKWRMRERGTNPCEFVEAYAEESRQRILTRSELERLWAVLDRWDSRVPMAPLVQLLLLTGCRVSEWRLALWSWLDLERGTLSLPDRAAKNGQREVTLAPEVVSLLEALPRTSVYVLPGDTGGPIQDHEGIWQRIRKAADLEGVRLHDLRHTVGSYAHREGLGLKAVADLLGHKQLRTAERYIHGIGSEAHRNATIVAGAIFRPREIKRPPVKEAAAS